MGEITAAELELLKAAHDSLAIRFGTSAPFKVGRVSAEKVGFAQLPSVVVTVTCREQDLSALVPIVRQCVYGELGERGWTSADLGFRPSVEAGRRRKYRDENESSPSFGRDKMGVEHRFRFDMGPDLAAATFVGFGSFKQLPARAQA